MNGDSDSTKPLTQQPVQDFDNDDRRRASKSAAGKRTIKRRKKDVEEVYIRINRSVLYEAVPRDSVKKIFGASKVTGRVQRLVE